MALGCSSGPAGEEVGQQSEASVCATGATVKGVDVSVYQGSVNWASVKASGVDFAIARISDGSYLDTTFATNWAAIKSAGMVRGAYQFFEPGEDPTAQANIVISAVGTLGDGDLPVTADMEVTGGQSAATIAANLSTWAAKVEAGTGKKPMIYTAPGYWDGSVGSTAFGGDPLWVANWGVSCPSLPSGWSNWKVWQYSDSGSVSGISGSVDLDEFNGSLSDLQAFAGGAPDYAAQYVSQTWPLATMTMTMTTGQVIGASITLKNVGKKSWDSNTKLATTQPRDRKSAFSASWPAGNRLAAVSGTVAPGSEFTFKFDFTAPSTPGTFDEFFGVVQEGVAWFSDPGQGGPADNDIEAKIQVVAADYAATFVSQSFPLAPMALSMNVGDHVDGYIELKNSGTQPWKAGVTKLAPTPRDKASSLGADGWLSTTRVSSPTADVAPGGSFKFPVRLTASAAGDLTQTFGLVEEGVTWFADAPKGGGPADDALKVHVVVGDAVAGDAGATSSADGGGSSVDGGDAGGGDGGAARSGAASSGGCSCVVVRAGGVDAPAAWVAGALGVVSMLARRRRR
jgi:lysozyme